MFRCALVGKGTERKAAKRQTTVKADRPRSQFKLRNLNVFLVRGKRSIICQGLPQSPTSESSNRRTAGKAKDIGW